MTQQAVSGQIRQLERIVGTPLVRRLPSGVELTVAGQAVVKQGRSLLTATTAMVDEARRIGSGRSGRLRIAFKAQSTAHFMPEVEAALCRTASDVQVEPVAMHTLPDHTVLAATW
jgi:DNA-binding transcriptional LysR family regulator